MMNSGHMDLRMLARVLADTIVGPDELEAAVKERLKTESAAQREWLAAEICQLRRAAVESALVTGCNRAAATELMTLIDSTLPQARQTQLATPDAVPGSETYASLATEGGDQSDLAQQIGSCFAGRAGAPGDEEFILAGGAIFTAVLGGTLGLLLQRGLFVV
jgi:hypothetical protein